MLFVNNFGTNLQSQNILKKVVDSIIMKIPHSNVFHKLVFSIRDAA